MRMEISFTYKFGASRFLSPQAGISPPFISPIIFYHCYYECILCTQHGTHLHWHEQQKFNWIRAATTKWPNELNLGLNVFPFLLWKTDMQIIHSACDLRHELKLNIIITLYFSSTASEMKKTAFSVSYAADDVSVSIKSLQLASVFFFVQFSSNEIRK